MIKIDAHDLAIYVKAQRHGPLCSILDEVRDYVFIKDVEGRFIFSNRAHLFHLGMKHESEILGKTDFDLFPAGLAEDFYSAETHLFETQTPVIRLQESIDLKGDKFYSTVIKFLICDQHGDALGLVGSVHRIASGDSLDIEQSKAHILSILRHQQGVTHSQLMAFEASLPTLLGKH